MKPVCYVCGNEDETTLPVHLSVFAQQLPSGSDRSMLLNTQVCDRCWQTAAISNLVKSARAEDRT